MGIREKIEDAKMEIIEAKQNLEIAVIKLSHIQELCPHTNIKSWTNNDGDGQFTVNRCLDCELQKDGLL